MNMGYELRAEKVLGHMCDALKKYQDSGGGCVPSFNEEGHTVGCDDTNEIPIIFCPFCGIKLQEDKNAH
jgi:hypothetical protein